MFLSHVSPVCTATVPFCASVLCLASVFVVSTQPDLHDQVSLPKAIELDPTATAFNNRALAKRRLDLYAEAHPRWAMGRANFSASCGWIERLKEGRVFIKAADSLRKLLNRCDVRLIWPAPRKGWSISSVLGPPKEQPPKRAMTRKRGGKNKEFW